MDPADRTELRRLLVELDIADRRKRTAVHALYAYMQQVLRLGDRGSIFDEMAAETPFRRRRLEDIKAGRWYRDGHGGWNATLYIPHRSAE